VGDDDGFGAVARGELQQDPADVGLHGRGGLITSRPASSLFERAGAMRVITARSRSSAPRVGKITQDEHPASKRVVLRDAQARTIETHSHGALKKGPSDQRFDCELNGVGVAQLVRREAAPDTRLGGEPAEFDAPRWRSTRVARGSGHR
jgi:hypothetical protein